MMDVRHCFYRMKISAVKLMEAVNKSDIKWCDRMSYDPIIHPSTLRKMKENIDDINKFYKELKSKCEEWEESRKKGNG